MNEPRLLLQRHIKLCARFENKEIVSLRAYLKSERFLYFLFLLVFQFICFPLNRLCHVLYHFSVLAYAIPSTRSIHPQITPVHLLDVSLNIIFS